MDAIAELPEFAWAQRPNAALNYLKPNGFRFQIHALPNVSFFCSSANIPDMTLGTATVPTPLIDLHEPGEKIVFGELSIRFLIQENMQNFKEIYDWLVGLGFPEDHEQYADFDASRKVITKNKNFNGNFSDATLFILDSNSNPNISILFQDAYPVALGGLEFEVSSGNTDYFIGIATFRYRQYKIQAIA